MPSLPPGAFLFFLAVTFELGSGAYVWVVGVDVCSSVLFCCVSGFLVDVEIYVGENAHDLFTVGYR